MKNNHINEHEDVNEVLENEVCGNEEVNNDCCEGLKRQNVELKQKMIDKENENKDLYERLHRIAADFENYKKRTMKERDVIYSHAVSDVMKGLLPILDNLQKASDICNKDDADKVIEGISMIQRQLKELLHKFHITEIEALNKKFDPEYHEAVVHVTDENCGENEIIEELRKGYKCGETVIRHSMVKVAN